MKILQVANIRWLNAEVDYALRISKGLAARGHEVHFAGLPGTKPVEVAAGLGLPVIAVAGLNTNNPLGWIASFRQLYGLARREGYDLVCGHRSEGFAVLAAAFRKGSPKTVIVRTRGDVRPPRDNFLNRKLYGEWADGLIASGKVVQDMLVRGLGVDPSRVKVIYYGVDTEVFRPGLPASELLAPMILDGWPVVGYVGRAGETKGEKYLLQVLSQVARNDERVRFVLAIKDERGDPARIRTDLKRHGLEDRTLILGEVEDVPRLMNGFSIGLVSSVGSEANCRTTLEMMACGVPVVATAVGIIPEVLGDDQCGLVVPPREPEAMVMAINGLLKDEALRHRMAESSRRRVSEKFSLSLMLRLTIDRYSRLAGEKRI